MKFSFTSILAALGHALKEGASYLESSAATSAPASAVGQDVHALGLDVGQTVKSAASAVPEEATNALASKLTPVFGGSSAVATIAAGAVVQAVQAEGMTLLSDLKL